MYFTLILKLYNIKLLFVPRTKAIIPAEERFPTMIEDYQWMIKATLRASHQDRITSTRIISYVRSQLQVVFL